MTTRVPARGPQDARIMVVGEAPGAQEEREGKPFVGAAGQLQDEMFLSVGIKPSEVFYTNLCKRRPPANNLSAFYSDDGIPDLELIKDLEELKEEIEAVNPNIIIAAGNFPMKHLTGKGKWKKAIDYKGFTGIGDYRGYLYAGTKLAGGRKVVPTYHPANVLREFSNKSIVKLDLSRVKAQSSSNILARPTRAWEIDPRGLVGREDWRKWLTGPAGNIGPTGYPADAFLTADIEYPGNRLVCIGFTRNGSTAGSFAIHNEADLAWVRSILLSGVPLCWQNGMFDASILKWFYDIDTFPFIKHDTLYAMHSAYTEYPKDLGFIGSLYSWDDRGSCEYWKDAIDWKKVGKGEQSMEEVYAYNAPDTSETHNAMRRLLDDELTDERTRQTYEFEIAMVPVLWQLSQRGVRIDTARLASLRNTLEREVKDLEAALYLLNNNSPVNPKSSPQVAKFIYETLGISSKGMPQTPKKAWVMNDDTLGALLLRSTTESQKRGITVVRKARERRDLISKFCDIELDDDGRMRCHYDPGKTDTGRLASRKFYPSGRGSNLQNVPRDTRVRSVFIPDPGYKFGYADLKQAEALVVAHLSGDPEMLRLTSEAFEATGGDGHKYVAAYLFNKRIEDITGDERYIGKRSRHSLNYHLGPVKFMTKINADAQETGVSITLQQAKQFIQKYLALHPYLVRWWDEIRQELYARRQLHNLLGRPHIFFGRPDSIIPEATAFVPQSTVGDVLNIGLVRSLGGRVPYDDAETARRCAVWATELAELDYQPLLQVHDAIGYQAPESNFDRVTELLTECMKVTLPIARRGEEPYTIQIPVDVKAGYNWGEWDSKKPDLNPNGLRKWPEKKAV